MTIMTLIIILALITIFATAMAWYKHQQRLKKFAQIEEGWQNIIDTANRILKKMG